ncbi:dTDP-4-amino-4,6-dideoxyglucose formyltransferase [Clostridium aciditolerans]|uniref:dTDP-4-amino-4,6-dideoxyglucose formyltransferase n=1 Tax=Clostridium aciditolerans TaxID=339861 RepID=A0A934M318_9CLOT|nr:dTDP-4-amino-4,6-dideoxyglucose formyltransferase [Clostridium aciditolerans]MBI6872712.1 dTDP-4-amino-4,6-dideoxyglucose formyltransferase [Clostridium aciditolerans]
MKIMVLTDNEFIYNEFKEIIKDKKYNDINFEFFFSESNKLFKTKFMRDDFKSIDLKCRINELVSNYKLVLSLHCKQMFPSDLVNQIRCVNVHPGFNPYNRGWFPQVFSIINKLPTGVTIHEMDEELDHGNIIAQKKVDIFQWETAYEVYKKIQYTEIQLLKIHLRDIVDNNYKAIQPLSEGNINKEKDFNKLCEINLNKLVTFKEAIDYLRAVSFSGYKNAYFYDESGEKIFVEIKLELEKDKNNVKQCPTK